MSTQPTTQRVSPFVELDRQTWSRLSHEIDVPLTAQEIENLRGLGDRLDAVSYTHLDVYKRQGTGPAGRRP